MSIHDYLSEEQINKINTVIRIQCEQAAHNDAVERNRISADLYNKLKKGRKAHDLTGDIYVALFYQENTIEGLKLVPQNMDKNKEILEYIGLCDEDFKQMGLLNLYPDIRLWYYKPVIEFFEDNNISYSIADNDLHYLTNNYCCCGDKLIETQTTFHNTFLFKKYNHYGLNDVFKELGTLKDCKCNGLFTSNRIGDCVTVEDFYNERFCKKSSPFSPSFSYFEYNRCLDEWI